MPNWCNNSVEIYHDDPAMIERVRKGFNGDGLFGELIPCPKELIDTVSGFLGEDQKAAHEAQQAANVEKYGYANWYDFQVANWGTKWDVESDSIELDEDGLGFSGSFESAWSPPMGVVTTLVEQGFEVTLFYYESGMAYVGKWEDGIDNCYEYGQETADTVRAAIGDELDDMFGISECMAEYESENPEEELTEWIKDGADKLKLETL